MAFSAHDIVSDSPTNNFATFNPLDIGTSDEVFREGNTFRRSGDTYSSYDIGKTNFIIPKTGKWYAEFCVVGQRATDPPTSYFGILKSTAIPAGDSPHPDNGYFFAKGTNNNTPDKYDGITPSYSTMSDSISTPLGFIAQVFFDADNNKIWFGLNNTWLESGNPSAGTGHIYTTSTAYDWVFSAGRNTNDGGRWSEVACNFGQDPTFGGNKTPSGGTNSDGSYPDKSTSGIGGFFYEPPAGALALCTANLPEMTSTVDDDVPKDYFKAVKYVGDYSSPATISVGFNPDLVWIKQRTPYASQSHCIYDSVRGVSKRLYSDSTSQEITPDGNGGVTNFSDNNGFELTRPTNQAFEGFNSSMQMIAWCWKAGGTPSGGFTGTEAMVDGSQTTCSALASSAGASITPTAMSVNTNAGFSIIKWVGNNANNATIPHGLTKEPDFVIIKNLTDTTVWIVKLNPNTNPAVSNEQQYLYLNLVNNFGTNTGEETQLTSNTIKFVGTSLNSTNGSNDNMIAYCWHSVEGYSKFGSYTGNGSPDGPFVYTGFRPAWVMVKNFDLDGSSWFIWDSKRSPNNEMKDALLANDSLDELHDREIDFLSNGFKPRANDGNYNQNYTYIFMAFAEQPFNFTNSR